MEPFQIEPMRRYRRAANYLSAAQIFLRDNVLLEEPLRPHLKRRPLGHWGTCPGITFVDVTAEISLVVVTKNALPQYLSAQEAADHARAGTSAWHWAGSCDEDDTPDVVVACAGPHTGDAGRGAAARPRRARPADPRRQRHRPARAGAPAVLPTTRAATHTGCRRSTVATSRPTARIRRGRKTGATPLREPPRA